MNSISKLFRSMRPSSRSRRSSHRRQYRRLVGTERLENRTLLAADFDFVFGLGSPGEEVGGSVATDADGNVYAAGLFSQMVYN